MSYDKTEDILKASGFKIFSPKEKLELELEKISMERELIKNLKRLFKKTPDKILVHSFYGEITYNHKMLSGHYSANLDSKEEELNKELKRVRIKEKAREVDFYVVEEKQDAKENNAKVIPLHGN